jgi:hypothetical protein
VDYYKCDKCRKVFDEFEMDFNFSQKEGITLCGECKDYYLTMVQFMKEKIENSPKKE